MINPQRNDVGERGPVKTINRKDFCLQWSQNARAALGSDVEDNDVAHLLHVIEIGTSTIEWIAFLGLDEHAADVHHVVTQMREYIRYMSTNDHQHADQVSRPRQGWDDHVIALQHSKIRDALEEGLRLFEATTPDFVQELRSPAFTGHLHHVK